MLLFLCGGLTSVLVTRAAPNHELLGAIFLFGATTMPLYAMALATAANSSRRSEFVEIGTSVLLLNGIGAVLAPLVLGPLMGLQGSGTLFWGAACLCGVGLLFTALTTRHAPPVDEPVPFSVATPAVTPTSLDLDPRAPGDASGDLAPAVERPSIADSLAVAQESAEKTS
jgi:MFS family permease